MIVGDEWGTCLNDGHCVEYFEQNATTQNFHNITIYEPCNYASNIAYYHVTTNICRRRNAQEWSMEDSKVVALGEMFVHLGFGSALWHGSHTFLGNVMDNRFIEIVSWVAYQASIQNLPIGDSPILSDLQSEKR